MYLTFSVTSSPTRPSPRVAALDQPPALVAQIEREPVDLELAEPVHRPTGGGLGASCPLGELVGREHVVEAEHALGVFDGCEQRRLAAPAHGERGTVLALQLGVRPLERLEPVHQLVVLGVGDDHGVALVVRVACLVDADGEVFDLVCCVGQAEALVDLVVHVPSLGTTPDTVRVRRMPRGEPRGIRRRPCTGQWCEYSACSRPARSTRRWYRVPVQPPSNAPPRLASATITAVTIPATVTSPSLTGMRGNAFRSTRTSYSVPRRRSPARRRSRSRAPTPTRRGPA